MLCLSCLHAHMHIMCQSIGELVNAVIVENTQILGSIGITSDGKHVTIINGLVYFFIVKTIYNILTSCTASYYDRATMPTKPICATCHPFGLTIMISKSITCYCYSKCKSYFLMRATKSKLSIFFVIFIISRYIVDAQENRKRITYN